MDHEVLKAITFTLRGNLHVIAIVTRLWEWLSEEQKQAFCQADAPINPNMVPEKIEIMLDLAAQAGQAMLGMIGGDLNP